MERVVSVEEMRNVLTRSRQEGRTIGFVPTMGALHEGHLTLVRACQRHADLTVVSIFVNPTQFGPGEDYEAYPRDLEGDAALLAAEGVDVLFAPSVAEMYPQGATTTVDPGPIADLWCGATRPGHFAGVATVVTKLLEIVGPDVAFFGEKDYQQLAVVSHVVRDLGIGTRIVGVPVVREPSGLARSSRNVYLSDGERAAAAVLWRALSAAQEAARAGETDATAIAQVMRETIASEPLVELEYAAIIDAETLQEVTAVLRPCRALVAARVGAARLIDNVAILPAAAP